MAPEQAAADPHTDHRADIYALGVLGYEILTGQPPFTAPSAQAVVAAHLAQAPTPLATMRPSVPPALATLIMRCLEKRPADRWQSAGELLHVLESFSTPVDGVATTSAAPSRGAGPRGGGRSRCSRWVPVSRPSRPAGSPSGNRAEPRRSIRTSWPSHPSTCRTPGSRSGARAWWTCSRGTSTVPARSEACRPRP